MNNAQLFTTIATRVAGVYAFVLACSLICTCAGCGGASPPPPQQTRVDHVVAVKAERVESRNVYRYNIWTGDFVLVPVIETVYVLAFADGGERKVPLGEYAAAQVGDTVTEYVWRTQYAPPQ